MTTNISKFYLFDLLILYIHSAILLISVISAGNHSTEFNSSFVNHLAASCSVRTSCPETISAQKQSIDKWNVG